MVNVSSGEATNKRQTAKHFNQNKQYWTEPSEAVPIPVQSLLGDWEGCRYDFHWYDGPHARLMRWYQENQQDALVLPGRDHCGH